MELDLSDNSNEEENKSQNSAGSADGSTPAVYLQPDISVFL